MAECNVSQITISGTARSDIRGVYNKTGVDSNGFAIFSKNIQDYQIREDWDLQSFRWVIVAPLSPNTNQFIPAILYRSQDFGSFNNILDCPTDSGITWTRTNPIYASGTPILTITGIPPAQNFGLPAATVAIITSRFRTVANYLRLRNQGQI